MPDSNDDQRNHQLSVLVGHKRRVSSPSPYGSRIRSRLHRANVNMFENLAILKSAAKRASMDANVEAWQRKVIASIIPDEILLSESTNYDTTFSAAVLVADATGFTELSERYNKMGKGGASVLSDVLSRYLGPMIQEIMHQGGDVIKFAGDAFLVSFKASADLPLYMAVTRAIDTSVVIQNSFGRYETEVGVCLRIKIVISAGEVFFSTIGNDTFGRYILIGQPVWECRDIGHIAKPGDVLISKRVLNLINTTEYVYEVLDDVDNFFRIVGFSERWKSENVPRLSDALHGEFTIRPYIKNVVDQLDREKLWRFLIPMLQASVEMKEPIEYLNEMRHIVIAFANLVPIPGLDERTIMILCDRTFVKVHEIVVAYDATLNKVRQVFNECN